ncbi:MAG: histidinol-phosphate transaminase [Elusimicrobia bacterium]|nr:histidinol-phosphate transaminase [Elusimicrobiota bacterium]
MNILDLARPHLRSVAPYKSARSLAAGGEVLLDANESPRVLSDDPELDGLNRYPAPQPPELVRQAAGYYGVPAERVVVTRGADEGIDLLTRTFVEPGRESVLITPPTYGVYAIAARLHGAGVVEVPLDAAKSFALDASLVLAAAKAAPVKLVYICRPNNPTGTDADLTDVAALAAELAGRALVVVDEAYLEFSARPSAAQLTGHLPNLVVLKTLSKAWGLAGARVGFTLADAAVAGLLHTVRAPYPISAAAARAAETVFNAPGASAMKRSVSQIIEERRRVAARLKALPCVEKVLPSEANFLIAILRNKDAALTALRSRGIIVRDRSAEPGLAGGVRVTIGLAEENDRLLDVLEKLDG